MRRTLYRRRSLPLVASAAGAGRRRADPAVAPRHHREEGYNLVMLIVAITLLNIAVAVALPLWSYLIRRDREEETIFRGLQYAEAIRVFQQRNGRYPTSLEELVKVEPRSIRQLWTETLTDHGEFGLVVEAPAVAPAAPGQPRAPGQPPALPGQPVNAPAGQPGGNAAGGFGVGGQGRGGPLNLIKLPRVSPDGNQIRTTGPVAIHGVYLDHRGDALRKFFGQEKYEQWTFTAELIRPPVTVPDRPLPRVRSDWLGKPFPEGLAPAQGTGAVPGTGAPVAPGRGPGRKPGAPEREPAGRDDEEPADDEPPLVFPEDFPEDEPPPDPVDVPDEPEFPEDEPMTEEPPSDQEPRADPDLDEAETVPEENAR